MVHYFSSFLSAYSKYKDMDIDMNMDMDMNMDKNMNMHMDIDIYYFLLNNSLVVLLNIVALMHPNIAHPFS